jgi:hypothetical protein
MGVGARRRHSLGARLDDVNGLATRKLGRRFRDLDGHEFAGQTVSHEDDSPIAQSPYGTPGGRTFDPNGALN